jgi:hypothetical protein
MYETKSGGENGIGFFLARTVMAANGGDCGYEYLTSQVAITGYLRT